MMYHQHGDPERVGGSKNSIMVVHVKEGSTVDRVVQWESEDVVAKDMVLPL